MAGAMVAGCGRNPCTQLSRTVCEQAPNTPACERASRTTNSDECEGLLKDVARFIALANEKIETPVLEPPAPAAQPGGPEAAASGSGQGPAETPPEGTPAPQGAAEPAEATAPAKSANSPPPSAP